MPTPNSSPVSTPLLSKKKVVSRQNRPPVLLMQEDDQRFSVWSTMPLTRDDVMLSSAMMLSTCDNENDDSLSSSSGHDSSLETDFLYENGKPTDERVKGEDSLNVDEIDLSSEGDDADYMLYYQESDEDGDFEEEDMDECEEDVVSLLRLLETCFSLFL
jgi:hypothetical protein